VHEADSAVRLGTGHVGAEGSAGDHALDMSSTSSSPRSTASTTASITSSATSGTSFGQDRIRSARPRWPGLLTVVVPAVLGNLLTGSRTCQLRKTTMRALAHGRRRSSLICCCRHGADSCALLRRLEGKLDGAMQCTMCSSARSRTCCTKGAKASDGDATSETEKSKDWLGSRTEMRESLAGEVFWACPGLISSRRRCGT
jgi:hypothetical protein